MKTKIEIGCPGNTIRNAIADLKNVSVSDDVKLHVHTCPHCRSFNHNEDCLSYGEIVGGINLMPPRMTTEQAEKLHRCPSCRVLLNEDGKIAYERFYPKTVNHSNLQ